MTEPASEPAPESKSVRLKPRFMCAEYDHVIQYWASQSTFDPALGYRVETVPSGMFRVSVIHLPVSNTLIVLHTIDDLKSFDEATAVVESIDIRMREGFERHPAESQWATKALDLVKREFAIIKYPPEVFVVPQIGNPEAETMRIYIHSRRPLSIFRSRRDSPQDHPAEGSVWCLRRANGDLIDVLKTEDDAIVRTISEYIRMRIEDKRKGLS